jgi:hypothetical protein
MLFDSEAAPLPDGYSFGGFLVDAAVGAAAMIAIAGLALALGGFMFFTPWLIVAPPVMFAAGTVRGSGQGKIWIKSLSITLGALLLFTGCSHTNALTATVGFLIAVVSTAAGIWFRRRRLFRRKDETIAHEQ